MKANSRGSRKPIPPCCAFLGLNSPSNVDQVVLLNWQILTNINQVLSSFVWKNAEAMLTKTPIWIKNYSSIPTVRHFRLQFSIIVLVDPPSIEIDLVATLKLPPNLMAHLRKVSCESHCTDPPARSMLYSTFSIPFHALLYRSSQSGSISPQEIPSHQGPSAPGHPIQKAALEAGVYPPAVSGSDESNEVESCENPWQGPLDLQKVVCVVFTTSRLQPSNFTAGPSQQLHSVRSSNAWRPTDSR